MLNGDYDLVVVKIAHYSHNQFYNISSIIDTIERTKNTYIEEPPHRRASPADETWDTRTTHVHTKTHTRRFWDDSDTYLLKLPPVKPTEVRVWEHEHAYVQYQLLKLLINPAEVLNIKRTIQGNKCMDMHYAIPYR